MLGNRSVDQRLEIVKTFKTMFGKVKKNCTGNFFLICKTNTPVIFLFENFFLILYKQSFYLSNLKMRLLNSCEYFVRLVAPFCNLLVILWTVFFSSLAIFLFSLSGYYSVTVILRIVLSTVDWMHVSSYKSHMAESKVIIELSTFQHDSIARQALEWMPNG